MLSFTRMACVVAVAFLSTVPAGAEITVTRAEYAGGVLVVRGGTSQANQRVTMDGRYSTRTNRSMEFRFRVRYLPNDCGVTIRAGREVRPVRVSNCDMVGTRQRKTGRSDVRPSSQPDVSVDQMVKGPQIVPLTAEAMYQGWRASKVLGGRVVANSGEEFGIARNILMDMKGQIIALIVEAPSSAGFAEFVYRIPWSKIERSKPSHNVIVDIPPGQQRQYGLSPNEKSSPATKEFSVQAVIGDYARLQVGQAYGYVSDVVFTEGGQMLAVLVTRDFAAGGGTYAFGFPGTIGRWDPTVGYYGLPYVTNEQADAATVKVDPKRFGS